MFCSQCRMEGHVKEECTTPPTCAICEMYNHLTSNCRYNMRSRAAAVNQVEAQAAQETPVQQNRGRGRFRGRGLLQEQYRERPGITCYYCQVCKHTSRDCPLRIRHQAKKRAEVEKNRNDPADVQMISMDEERSQVTKMLGGLTEVLTTTRAQAKKRLQENIQKEMSLKNSWEEHRQVRDQAQGIIEKQQKKKQKAVPEKSHNYTGLEMPGDPSQRLEHNDTGSEMPREPSQRLEHNYTGPEMPGEPSQRLEHNYTGPEMPGEPSQRLEHNYIGPEMPGEPSQRLEHNYIGLEMLRDPSQRLEHNDTGSEVPGEPSQRLECNDTGYEVPGEPSQILEHNDTGLEMPGEPSQRLEHNNTGSAMPRKLSRKKLDHKCIEPGKLEKYRPGQDRPGKRAKQNSQSQVRRCPPNVKRTSKGDLKDMNELAIEALMDHKVPLRSILDLCPRFKEKVFKNWAEEINQKVKGLQCEVECHMTQPEEPREPGMTMWQK